jgi:hypothetical protein
MSRNLTDAAKGASEVSQNIGGVAQAARDTSQGASESFKAAQQLAQLSHKLRVLVEQFKLQTDSAPARRKRGPALPTSAPRESAVREDEGILTR